MNPVLNELRGFDDDAKIGATEGTTFYWRIGNHTKWLFHKYFDDGCIVTAKHLRFLATLDD